VPLKIVLYNIFSGRDRGPNIFGTEPWHFYTRNLLLNFNLWFLLAVAVGPLRFLQYVLRSQATTKQPLLKTAIITMPFYLWMAIFTLQPHKEERFMYPVYPFLALNAAVAFHMILAYLGSTNPKELVGKIPVQLKFAGALITVILSLDIGLLRTIGTVTAYRAPLQVYRALGAPGMARPGDTVCLGKEWYRFPSSHFLPEGIKAKFVKSEFSGLLPGEFSEAKTGFGFFPGTWLIPAGMNDRNEEDPGKYVSGFFVVVEPASLIFPRLIYHTVRLWWTRICRAPRPRPQNQNIFSMIRCGKGFLVHHFLTHQRPAS
jgi:alpha-1,2-mannosyltransferase